MRQSESNRVEFKQELNEHLEKEVIAFLNSRSGGALYLGINKHGNTIGLDNPDQIQLTVKDRLKNNIQPSALGLFDVLLEERDGKDILKIINKITPRERISLHYWHPVALREAVINAIIHNEYAAELVPKFEVFSDRLEITSAGSVHPGEEQEDFFSGYSMPRNKSLMRVFKDLEMVEYLGSGLPRILSSYSRDSYLFSSHFIRTTLPISSQALALEQELEKTELQSSGKTTGKRFRKEVRKMLRRIKKSWNCLKKTSISQFRNLQKILILQPEPLKNNSCNFANRTALPVSVAENSVNGR